MVYIGPAGSQHRAVDVETLVLGVTGCLLAVFVVLCCLWCATVLVTRVTLVSSTVSVVDTSTIHVSVVWAEDRRIHVSVSVVVCVSEQLVFNVRDSTMVVLAGSGLSVTVVVR